MGQWSVWGCLEACQVGAGPNPAQRRPGACARRYPARGRGCKHLCAMSLIQRGDDLKGEINPRRNDILPRTIEAEARTIDVAPRTKLISPRTIEIGARANDTSPRTIEIRARAIDLGPRTKLISPRTKGL